MTKQALKAALIAQLEEQLSAARMAHRTAVEGATHEQARAENSKDTRGLEQSYLARGQAQRVADLELAVTAIGAWQPRAFGAESIALGAVVTIEEAGQSRMFLIATHGGGLTLPGGVTVLTPSSPIGGALIGRSVDEEVELGKRALSITAIE